MGIAFVGLGADMPEDTIYPTTFYDADGKLLSGDGRYVPLFERGQLPRPTAPGRCRSMSATSM